MSQSPVGASHQLVIQARLAEFCSFHQRMAVHVTDPWEFMRQKLLQIEEPLVAMKRELLDRTRVHLLEELGKGPMSEERFSDYRLLFERLVSRGQFVDVAMHLGAAPPPSMPLLKPALASLKVHCLFDEERLPEAQRGPAWQKLVAELSSRLDLDLLDKVMSRKKRTPRKRAGVLRRLRRNVSEYCTVVRIPVTAADTFTPFMLPRIEALVAANLRFLNKHR